MDVTIQKPDADHAALQPLTKGRIARAFAIAVVVDLIQLPVNLAFFTGLLAVPSEALNIGLDIAASILISRAIGFHWVFLPSFLLETMPGFDLCPTWIASVAYVSWRRRKQQSATPPISATIVETGGIPDLRGRLTN